MTLEQSRSLIASRFLAQAGRTPGAVAVVDGGRELTYGRIAEAARELADRLRAEGVRPGHLVGVSVTRGHRVVIAVLATWLTGCAYVPVDPAYPAARRAYVLGDARVRHLLTDANADTAPAGPAAPAGLAVTAVAAGGPEHRVPDDTAYVIYTSGSTGAPKGVCVAHRNVAALLDGAESVLPAGPGAVATVFHSYCFDFSVWEIWRPLTTGGRCVFVTPEAALDAGAFARLLAEHRVSALSLVPSVFGNLVQALEDEPVPLPHLREVVFGGEPVDLGAVRAWYGLALAPAARLVNMYGITETTVHVTAEPLDPAAVAAFRGPGTPIGRPLPHLAVEILGDDGRPVPDGETGEMYVTGEGVAAGYLDRPELTAERFVRLALDGGRGRWYRTGDLARRTGDGRLVFAGRRDGQVQLRGHRVELGEIEAVVSGVPGVTGAGAVVVANRMGEPVLVACYAAADTGRDRTAEVRAALAAHLPRYMMPGRLLRVDRIPVTPEGKLDRAALAELAREDRPAVRAS